MTHFGPKKCTVSLWERQFATLCLFHACTGGGGGGRLKIEPCVLLAFFPLFFAGLEGIWAGLGSWKPEFTICPFQPPKLQARRAREAPPRPLGPGTPEESEKRPGKSAPGQGPKSPKECGAESQKSLIPGLFSDSFETPGRTLLGLLGSWPGALFPGLFSDTSGAPGPKGPGDLAWGGANRKARETEKEKKREKMKQSEQLEQRGDKETTRERVRDRESESCKPERLGEGSKMGKSPKVAMSFVQKVFWTEGAKKPFAPVQNRVAHGARDSWETFAPSVHKTLCTLS